MVKSFFPLVWETLKVIIVALLIVIPIRYFLFQPFIVSGHSMEPNYSHGDYLIVDEISYRFRDPQRGEVVVFRYPQDLSFRHIKRVIGLPEETIIINNGRIRIITPNEEFLLDESEYLFSSQVNEEIEIVLGEDEFFVLGDNRPASFDSRRWGSLLKEYIIGRTAVKVFPLSGFGISKIPEY